MMIIDGMELRLVMVMHWAVILTPMVMVVMLLHGL